MMADSTLSGDITFGCPDVSPKHYIVKGPSGWPETFLRKDLDCELAAFVAPLPIDEAVDLFTTAREIADDKRTNWHTIVGFIGRMMGVSPRGVPHRVGIAFWAQYTIAQAGRNAN